MLIKNYSFKRKSMKKIVVKKFAKVFLFLCKSSIFRRLVWNLIYQFLAKKNAPDWNFMNYGYALLANSQQLKLLPEDEQDRYCIQLYHYLLSNTKISQKNVLEVGSGRGGGASYIKRYLKPKSMIGLDLSQNAVDLSNSKHQIKNLSYIQGNAEALPFDDNAFDVVVNVESAHNYGSMISFFKEVKRVLKPNGVFLYADIVYSKNKVAMLDKQLIDSGMQLISSKVITKHIVKAMELDHDRKVEQMKKNIDSITKSMIEPFSEFAGLVGSEIYNNFASEKSVYKWHIMQA